MKVAARIANGEAVSHREVPDEWADQRDRAADVSASLAAHLAGEEGVRQVGLTTTDDSVGGYSYHGVTVFVDADSDLAYEGAAGIDTGAMETAVPDDVSIDVEPVSTDAVSPETVEPDHYDGAYDPLQAGVSIEARGATGQVSRFSLGACGRYNSEKVIFVSRHPFVTNTATQQICSMTTTGATCYQGGRRLGSLLNAEQSVDTGLIMPSNRSVSLSNQIVDQAGTVQGHLTRQELQAMAAGSSDNTVHFRGRTSGVLNGKITATGVRQHCDPDEYPGSHDITDALHVRFHDGATQGGDSGGPLYHKDGGKLYLAGFLLGLRPSDKISVFISAARVVEAFDGDVQFTV